MGKHTPGPWVAKFHPHYRDTDWRIKPAHPIRGSTAGFAPLAIVKGDERIYGEAEKEANARLIAAAPELLESAKDALGMLEDMQMTCGCGGSDCKTTKIRAAIAKAEAA